MPTFLRNLTLVSLAVACVAAMVWGVQERQRETVERSFELTEGVQEMLTGMLDQETALRGYLQTGRESFLEPYGVGRQTFDRAVRRTRRSAEDLAPASLQLVDRGERLSRVWQQRADEAVYRARLTGRRRVPIAEAISRKALMDQIRATNAELHARVDRHRTDAFAADQRLAVALIVFLAFGFGGVGYLAIGRPAERQRAARRRQDQRRDLQAEFARTMQVMDGEQEAHELVHRHLERVVAGSKVVVLQRNNSADRLFATTPLDAGDPLAEALVDAEPRSCLAVRLGREHAEHDGRELLQCELCGKTGTARASCTPLVVSGEVIGSVLVGHDAPLDVDDEHVVADTVTQAAPVLANMRNLTIAEARASTDALTGLANRRAVQDTVRRMVAQAQRAGDPLAFVAIDVDHFKRINDRLGHDRGDDVLAAVAQALAGTLRASDFVGRQGGEEFVALLHDTDLSGALTAAENLRAAIEALDVLGPSERVTASFGIAVLPEDGADGATLMRQADRALYAAKANGRNRVETAAAGTVPHEPASPQTAG